MYNYIISCLVMHLVNVVMINVVFYSVVTIDEGCFKSPEGFFNTDLWQMDYRNLQKQIFHAIQQCPMDARKHMYR